MTTVQGFDDVELGDDLPTEIPDVSMAKIQQFCRASKHEFGRFVDHEIARKEGFEGALVPGIMSQGLLAAMIHRWAPDAEIKTIDTVFRAPVIADEPHHISGVVTDIDTDAGMVEIDLTVMNSKDETRVFGTATVKLPN